jgi:CarD family transcriptional regulator
MAKKKLKKRNIKVKVSKKGKRKKNIITKTNPILTKSRYFKSNEQKAEIKKIRKQPSEKKIYNVKDYVVYPKHGVGKIQSVEKAQIGSIQISFYKVLIKKDKLTLSIPLNQQSHLRPVCSTHQINNAISVLKTKPKIKRTMWSRRAQEYDEKINSGKIYELAEVVRDLNKNTTDMMADQSYSERQLFEKAYDRLLNEVEVVLNIDTENAQKKLDKALGRLKEETIIQG